MPKVGVARRATNFGPAHEPGAIIVLADGIEVDRRIEARPAGTGIEFRVRAEQGRFTADTSIHAATLFVPIRAREGTLGAVLAGHAVLRGRQPAAPLRLRLYHGRPRPDRLSFVDIHFARPASSINALRRAKIIAAAFAAQVPPAARAFTPARFAAMQYGT